MKKYIATVGMLGYTVMASERHRAYRLINPVGGLHAPAMTEWFDLYETCDHFPLALALLLDAGAPPLHVDSCAQDYAEYVLPAHAGKPFQVTALELLHFAAGWGAAVAAGRGQDDCLPPSPQLSEGGF